MSVDEEASKKEGYRKVSRSLPNIAERTGLSLSTVKRAMSDLEVMEWIEETKKRYNNYNSYAICTGIEDDEKFLEIANSLKPNSKELTKKIRNGKDMNLEGSGSELKSGQDVNLEESGHGLELDQDVDSSCSGRELLSILCSQDSVSQNFVSQDSVSQNFVVNPLTENNIENDLIKDDTNNKGIGTPVEDINLDDLKGISPVEEIAFSVENNSTPEPTTFGVPRQVDMVNISGTTPKPEYQMDADVVTVLAEERGECPKCGRKMFPTSLGFACPYC